MNDLVREPLPPEARQAAPAPNPSTKDLPPDHVAVRTARRAASAALFAAALRDAGTTACIAAALFLPFVGVKTETAAGGLILLPRFETALALVLATAGVRLVVDALFWRTAAPPAHRVAAGLALALGAILGAGLSSLLWDAAAAIADAVAGPPPAPEAALSFGREALRQTLLFIGHAGPPAILALAALLLAWRRLIPVGVMIVSTPHFVRLALGRMAVGLVILAGGVLFIQDGARLAFIDGAVQILGDGAAWSERVRIAANLLSLAAMGAFLLVAAMMASRFARLVLGVAAGREPPAPDLDSQTEALWGDLGRELTPALLMIALALPLLAAGPQQRYAVDTATQILTYVMLGWGLNVVVGLAGLLDLGYVAFYAVGAYSYALLAAHYDWSFWVCLPLAGLFAALWGVLLGFPVLRLRGDYLAIVTMAFGEIIRIVLVNWSSLTNGSNGLQVPKLTFFGRPFDAVSEDSFANLLGIAHSPIHRVIFLYYVILTLALLTSFVTVRLRRLPIGRAWEALREDEIACRSLGVNTTFVKLSAFATGAAVGGLAGSFFAAHHGFINPESFTFHESALILAIVVLGGMGSQTGVALAAIALVGSAELFRELEQYRMLIFGASMVAIMTWRPRGFAPRREPSVLLGEPGQRPAGAGSR